MRYRTGTVGRHYSRHNRSDKALSQSQVGSSGRLSGMRSTGVGPGRFTLLPSRAADHIVKATWTNPSTIIWCAPIHATPG